MATCSTFRLDQPSDVFFEGLGLTVPCDQMPQFYSSVSTVAPLDWSTASSIRWADLDDFGEVSSATYNSETDFSSFDWSFGTTGIGASSPPRRLCSTAGANSLGSTAHLPPFLPLGPASTTLTLSGLGRNAGDELCYSPFSPEVTSLHLPPFFFGDEDDDLFHTSSPSGFDDYSSSASPTSSSSPSSPPPSPLFDSPPLRSLSLSDLVDELPSPPKLSSLEEWLIAGAIAEAASPPAFTSHPPQQPLEDAFALPSSLRKNLLRGRFQLGLWCDVQEKGGVRGEDVAQAMWEAAKEECRKAGEAAEEKKRAEEEEARAIAAAVAAKRDFRSPRTSPRTPSTSPTSSTGTASGTTRSRPTTRSSPPSSVAKLPATRVSPTTSSDHPSSSPSTRLSSPSSPSPAPSALPAKSATPSRRDRASSAARAPPSRPRTERVQPATRLASRKEGPVALRSPSSPPSSGLPSGPTARLCRLWR